MEITHKNHWVFGWGNSSFNWMNQDGAYYSSFGRASYTPTSYRQACLNNAQLIAESAKKPIMVLCSGGIDSEIIVRCFNELNIKVVLGTMIFPNRINEHDYTFARQLAEELDLTIKEFHIDPFQYMRDGYEKDAEAFKEFAPSLLIHTKMLQYFSSDYHTVIGGGDLIIKQHDIVDDWLFIQERTSSCRTASWLMQNNVSGSPRFFAHTPESLLAFLTDPLMSIYRKQKPSFVHMSGSDAKYLVLHSNFPGLTPRPKFTGYEKLPEFFYDTQIRAPYYSAVDSEMKEIFINAFKKYRNFSKHENHLVTDLIRRLQPE